MKKAFVQLHIAVFLAGFTAILGRLITLNEGMFEPRVARPGHGEHHLVEAILTAECKQRLAPTGRGFGVQQLVKFDGFHVFPRAVDLMTLITLNES